MSLNVILVIFGDVEFALVTLNGALVTLNETNGRTLNDILVILIVRLVTFRL